MVISESSRTVLPPPAAECCAFCSAAIAAAAFGCGGGLPSMCSRACGVIIATANSSKSILPERSASNIVSSCLIRSGDKCTSSRSSAAAKACIGSSPLSCESNESNTSRSLLCTARACAGVQLSAGPSEHLAAIFRRRISSKVSLSEYTRAMNSS